MSASSILLITAHPDDEYYCAGAIYRLARELGQAVDQMIVTNGAGGHRFAALAGQVYGLDLSKHGKDHHQLPEVRKQEAIRAGKLLGIRKHYFLDESDPGFTQDPDEALEAWSRARIRGEIAHRLLEGEYSTVIVLVPRAEEHGHHQAVSQIALDAIRSLPEAKRPGVLAVEPGHSRQPAPAFGGKTKPHFEFSRLSTVRGGDCLNYMVIVNWMVAEYKSQGLFQLESGRHDCERFWVLGGNPSKCDSLFSSLAA